MGSSRRGCPLRWVDRTTGDWFFICMSYIVEEEEDRTFFFNLSRDWVLGNSVNLIHKLRGWVACPFDGVVDLFTLVLLQSWRFLIKFWLCAVVLLHFPEAIVFLMVCLTRYGWGFWAGDGFGWSVKDLDWSATHLSHNLHKMMKK